VSTVNPDSGDYPMQKRLQQHAIRMCQTPLRLMKSRDTGDTQQCCNNNAGAGAE
jgi:hypothetical protein